MPPSTAKKLKKKLKKAEKRAKAKVLVKAITKPVSISGSGDYRPTSFNRVRGKGDYFGNLGRSIGGGIGGLVDSGASLFKAITGMGDYRERSSHALSTYKSKGHTALPMLMAGFTNPQSMNMGAMNAQFGDVGPPRVRHREFIGPIRSSQIFNTTTYRIQPGLVGSSTLFPWGSSVARAFQQYKLHGMILEYKSTSTNYSSSVNLGSVMMSTVYDAEASPLATQIAVNNNEYTTSDEPCNSFIHPLECASKESPITVRYVRVSNSVNAGSTFVGDERFDDVGIFQISTVGQPTTGDVIGELWATYDIEFLKPELPDLHNGTSALFIGMDQSGGFDAVDYVANTNNSLPVTLQFTGPETLAIKMPVGYNGSYQITFFGTCHAGNNWGTGVSFSSPMYGADQTGLPLLVSSTGATDWRAAIEYASTNAIAFTYTCIFTTIAENAGQNIVYLSGGTFTSAAANWGVLVTAVDNDIQTHTDSFFSVKRRDLGREIASIEQRYADLERRFTELLEKRDGMSRRSSFSIEEEKFVSPPRPSIDLSNSQLLTKIKSALTQ